MDSKTTTHYAYVFSGGVVPFSKSTGLIKFVESSKDMVQSIKLTKISCDRFKVNACM